MGVTPYSLARQCCVGDQRWRYRHHPLLGKVDVHRPLHAVLQDLEDLECRARHATHLSTEDNNPRLGRHGQEMTHRTVAAGQPGLSYS